MSPIEALQTYKNRVPNLLIVDDNETNRILLARLFTAQGYRADTAENGLEALAALKKTSYDLILMDIMMPEMDGLSALEHIRAAENTASLPVVLISAMADTADIVRGLELGANDYIAKPIDMEIALARVKTQVALKLLMDERVETIRQMEESQKMREQFFRMASHDLKGPLTNMRVSEMLLGQLIDTSNERVSRIMDTMRVTINTMTNVVEDFLDSATIQTGQIDLKIAETDIVTLLRDTISGQSPYAYDKTIKIETGDIAGAVHCDPARTGQVLSNLLNNAIKYSPKGATVRVWTAPHEAYIKIHIRDEGPGIPTEERVRLFQPFGKLSTTPTAGESSHGLGLWIAKHLVDLQGGDIGVDCPPEGGSVFWVLLPIAA